MTDNPTKDAAGRLLINPEPDPSILASIKEVDGYYIPDPILKICIDGKFTEAIFKLRDYHTISYELSARIVDEVMTEIKRRDNGKNIQKD